MPLALGVAAGNVLAQASEFLGRPIVELIEHLRQQDIRIVYSDELLPARYRVTVEPASATPFDQLSEVLAPYGLDVELGPRDTWLVVRRTDSVPGVSGTGSAPARDAIAPPALERIVVTASRYSIDRPASISSTTVSRHVLENTSALGQDPIRVTQILPGVTSNQLTSRMHIRGGNFDESLIRLDGIRLYSPYHLKDFQSIFSSINPRIVESMDIHTGGFGAQFGDALSGVVDMHSITPTEPRRHEVTLSLLDTSILSSGLFSEGRGAWVTSLRRGNLDVLADLSDADIGRPQYNDFFNKLTFSISPNWTLSAGALTQDDKITLRDNPTATASASYDDAYLWLTANHSGSNGLESSVTLSSTGLHRTRSGTIDDPARVSGMLAEKRELHGQTLAASWSKPVADRLYVSWGIELRSLELNYQVQSTRSLASPLRFDDLSGPNAPPSHAQVIFDQSRYALFVNHRLRILPRLVADIGLRWDAQSIIDEQQTSPRLNLLFELSDRTKLRAAWGRFFQAHDQTEMAIADGSLELLPAEESEHRVLGIEHVLGDTITLRAELYEKKNTRLNHRFENVVERVSLIPELLPDRFEIEPKSARIRGLELSAEGGTAPWSWWTNVAVSESVDELGRGRFDRSWDEQWSLKLGSEWSGSTWTVTANTVFRSGWPITALSLTDENEISGQFNRQRLADFSSLNVRASRTIPTAKGQREWFIEVTNLLNRANYCCLAYDYDAGDADQPATLETERNDILGITPNLGLRWQF